ncbi:Protein tap1 [Orobanche gracilis]
MESRKIEMIAGFMLVIAMLIVGPVTAHLPPGTCIKHCLAECKLSGIDNAVCIKYCPVHCLPRDTSTKEHYCNLGCMLDKCAKFTSDEKNMSDCVSKCNNSQCKTDV